MLSKSITLLGGALVLAGIVASQFDGPPGAVPGAAGASPPRAADCAAGGHASPFARCSATALAATAAAPIGATRKQAAAGAQSAQGEAALVGQLEDLSRGGNPQAQFDLAMQFERSAQRDDQRALNAADVAEDPQLQRAVALLAQAVAAGNADAQQFRDATGEHARLLHTGR